jgi:hypothetical protein
MNFHHAGIDRPGHCEIRSDLDESEAARDRRGQKRPIAPKQGLEQVDAGEAQQRAQAEGCGHRGQPHKPGDKRAHQRARQKYRTPPRHGGLISNADGRFAISTMIPSH